MAPPKCPGADSRSVEAAALALLWRVRGLLTETTPPAVQFVRCPAPGAANGSASAVALAFARAAASLWGRALLIAAREGLSAGVMPDAFVPRLYHQCLGGADLYATLLRPDGMARQSGGMFNVVVIDQALTEPCDFAAMTARLCTGSVLVVQAGLSDLAAIQGAIGRIGAMGGTVLGTVLADIPAWARTW
jgi:hypothetical protein